MKNDKKKIAFALQPLIAEGTKLRNPPSVSRAIQKAIRSGKQQRAYGEVVNCDEENGAITIKFSMGEEMEQLLSTHNVQFIAPHELPIYPSNHVIDQAKSKKKHLHKGV